MKYVIPIFSILFISNISYCDSIFPPSKIIKATVFPKGAMVEREIDISKFQGIQTITIKDLPNDLHKKSINVEANNNVDIVSVNAFLKNNYSIDSHLLKKHKIQQISITDSLDYYKTLTSILKIEKTMITSHSDFANDDGDISIDDIIKASDFYKKRIKEIELSLLAHKKNIAFFYNELKSINNELDSLHKIQNVETFQVSIKADIKNLNSQPIKIQYFVPLAQWYAYYDLKVNDLDKPALIHRKAFVSQNTGEEWNDIKLILSNANPLESNRLPSLRPRNLQSPDQDYEDLSHLNYGVIRDSDGLILIGANILVEGTTNGVVSDIDGSFQISNPHNRNLIISYVGYNTKKIKSSRNHLSVIMSQSTLLDEVVIVESLQGSVAGMAIDGYYEKNKKSMKDIDKRNDINNTLQEMRQAISQTMVSSFNSVEYIIEDPYSIESNAEEIDVLLKTEYLDCHYQHFAVPSKSSKTFLTLQIEDWHRLDLLEGNVNLFLSNTYKGTSRVNPSVTSDTLRISVGHDPEVIVKKELMKELYDKKFFNKNIEEFFNYQITVKNNKSKPINIKILDQVPISNHEDIEIKNVDAAQGKLDEFSGKIEWILDLETGKSVKKKLEYSVKYPKEFSGILN